MEIRKLIRKPDNWVLISAGVLLGLALLIIGVATAIKSIADWGAGHQFVKQEILSLHIQLPYRIEKIVPKVIQQVITAPELADLTPIEQRICEKWGMYDCQVAIAVAKHEGLNHPIDSWNINTNGTIDVGYFRINSVHFNQPGCSLAEVITEEGNLNCAYQIWEAQGWTPWVAYTNGNYLKSLGE